MSFPIKRAVTSKPVAAWLRCALLAAAAIILSSALSACSVGSQPERDITAQAVLDTATNEIIMPMSDYLMVDRTSDVITFQRATRVAIDKCMRESGLQFSASQITEDPFSYPGDWTYGIWGEERASKYGWELAESGVGQQANADAEQGGAPAQQAQSFCLDEVLTAEHRFLPTNQDTANSLAPRLATEAYNKALEDPEWAQARALWISCLDDAGLTPPTDELSWTSKQTDSLALDPNPNLEESIRVATIEARCNEQTLLTQTLGNIEASYQQPLIDQHQAALNKEKERKQELLKAARDYISENG